MHFTIHQWQILICVVIAQVISLIAVLFVIQIYFNRQLKNEKKKSDERLKQYFEHMNNQREIGKKIAERSAKEFTDYFRNTWKD